jgi:hypothetical protein
MVYTARVWWNRRPDEAFVDSKYNRSHTWAFDGGTQVPASASPHVVPLPLSTEQGFVVESYEDQAEGALGKNAEGRLAMIRVVLKPRIEYSAQATPSPELIAELHHLAHERCFIANSVKTEVTVVQT